MNYRDINTSIGEVAAALPKATRIFKEYGIDFCCGGHRSLAAVMKEQGLPLNEVYDRLDQLVNNTDIPFDQMSSPVLSAYIEDTHHSYLRKALPEAAELLNTVLRVHGSKHRELFEMYQLFG
ncbi:MAG: iron-sulfur cluster repair di-iron protein [Anaerocolumna sp.]|nr:iron-sulfur cluster repair di-iron protein [Anaerocolumna sp.]